MALAHTFDWFVQQSAGSVASLATSFQTPGGGNFIAVVVAVGNTGQTISSVTDSNGNTYTVINSSPDSNNNRVAIAYSVNANTAGSIQITATPSASAFLAISAATFSGLATSRPFDKSSSSTGNSTSLDSLATATTTFPNELLIGAGEVSSGVNGTWTAGASYTLGANEGTSASGESIYLQWRVVSATGTYNAPATFSNSGPWAAAIATFADTPVGGSQEQQLLLGMGN